MLETALAQLRFAASVVLGLPFAAWSHERLIDAMRETQREFGAIGSEGAELLGGPVLDEEMRREVHLRRFRTQAAHGARETAYYGRLFQRLDLDPARLRYEDIQCVPVTPKEALRAAPDAFVRRTAKPNLRAMTTGTTGQPTSVYFSQSELRNIVAFAAIALLFGRHIESDDIVQVSMRSRGTLGSIAVAGACARIGALVHQTGLVSPAHALALLAEEHQLAGKKPRVSALATYPSYLGELIEYGLHGGYRPSDFGLERIFVGGEIVSDGLKARGQQLFGPVEFVENYTLTETVPFGGNLCSEGHLHFEPSQGLLEVQNLEMATPALPGEVGTIVVTPFQPYRDTTLLLRYDTQDLVRPIAGRLSCNLRNVPATTTILGRRHLAARHDDGWTFPRDLVEALEAIDEIALPARYGFWTVPGGVAIEVAVRHDTPDARRKIERRLGERDVPVRALYLAEDRSQLRRPVPLRCDLRESSFNSLPLSGHLPDERSGFGLPVELARARGG